jgi:hypothetical protein
LACRQRDLVVLRAGIHEEEGGEEHFLFPAVLEGEGGGVAVAVAVENYEAPIGLLEDQEGPQDDYGHNVVAVVVVENDSCHGGKEGGHYTWLEEVHHGEATQRSVGAPVHEQEILVLAGHEAHVCWDPLYVVLVQLADRQVAADCDVHAYQIRERPRTMAA